MNHFCYVLLFTIVFATPVKGMTINKVNCQKVAKQIKQVESRMRHGYTVKKGEQLMKRLRQLKKHRYACYKARLPIK